MVSHVVSKVGHREISTDIGFFRTADTVVICSVIRLDLVQAACLVKI